MAIFAPLVILMPPPTFLHEYKLEKTGMEDPENTLFKNNPIPVLEYASRLDTDNGLVEFTEVKVIPCTPHPDDIMFEIAPCVEPLLNPV
jgi:hypothetical protein